jgi:hypothetical protein
MQASGRITRSAEEWEMSRSCQRDWSCRAAEGLLQLADLGALQPADLGGAELQRAGQHRQGADEGGVAVAGQDLRRVGGGVEAELLADDALHPRVDPGVGADRPGELTDAHLPRGVAQAGAAAADLGAPAGELEAEGDGLGVDPVGAADHGQIAVAPGLLRQGVHQPPAVLVQQPGRLGELEREGGVHHVAGGQAVVQPAAGRTGRLGHRLDEGGDVVTGARLDLRHAGRVDAGRPAQGLGVLAGDHPQFGPGFDGGQLDLEPDLQAVLVRPDTAHGRAGVAGDHRWATSLHHSDFGMTKPKVSLSPRFFRRQSRTN